MCDYYYFFIKSIRYTKEYLCNLIIHEVRKVLRVEKLQNYRDLNSMLILEILDTTSTN